MKKMFTIFFKKKIPGEIPSLIADVLMCILSRGHLEFCYLGANKRLRRINERPKLTPA